MILTITLCCSILRYRNFLFDIDYRDTLISRYTYNNIVILPNSSTYVLTVNYIINVVIRRKILKTIFLNCTSSCMCKTEIICMNIIKTCDHYYNNWGLVRESEQSRQRWGRSFGQKCENARNWLE